MSKIDLNKKYAYYEYMAELNKLGIKHHSQEKSPHEMFYCGWCKHANIDSGSGAIDGWYLQSHCAKNDMTPVSEFCWCNDFGIDVDSDYWKGLDKEVGEIIKHITSPIKE